MFNRRSFSGMGVALALALAAATAPSAHVGAQEPPQKPVVYPELRGTTVIHGEGVVGITVMVPEPVRIWEANQILEVEEGTGFAWVGLRAEHLETGEEFCDFCLRFTEFYPEYDRDVNYAWCTDDAGDEVGCRVLPGPLQIYVVTDRALTYTIRFDELDGATELSATADVDGVVQELPIRGCDEMPDGTCGRIYGGTSRVIGGGGRPALGWVIGYYRAPGSQIGPVGPLNPGLEDLRVCAYPSSLFAGSDSGDPNDHPRGCDDESLLPGVQPLATGSKQPDVNWKADGEQYLGFTVWHTRTFDPGFWNAWGMWLEAGMVCTSRDFHDCTKPPPDDD